MYKRYKATILAIVGMLFLPMNVTALASEMGNEPILDGSVTDEDHSEVTELFDWDFDDPGTSNASEEVAPLGVYFAVGHAGIKKKSSTSVYITAMTDCYQKCDTVNAVANLQKLVNGTWRHVTDRSKTASNATTVSTEGTISAASGYYYRVVSFHNATKNGTTEYGSGTTRAILVK